MSATLAQLNGRVYLELEVVSEFLQLDQVHNAVVQKHNVRVAQSRNSTTNVLLGVSPTFSPADTKVDVTGYIGQGSPAWLEVQGEAQKWVPIPIVPTNQLHDYMLLGILAATFYTEEPADPGPNEIRTDPIRYVEFSFLPGNACRIRFDRDSVRIGLAETVELPDHVTELIVKEAQNVLIPRLKLAIDMRCRRDKELREIAGAIKQTLSELAGQNMLDIQPLDRLWREWAFRDRSRDEGSFNKPTPSSHATVGGFY